MKIIPTQLVVENCIIEVNKDEKHTLIRALYDRRIKYLRRLESEKNKNERAKIEMELEKVGVLEKALCGYYRISMTTEKNLYGDD